MKLRDIVKNFVVSRFDITDDFFNTAWDFVNANYSKIHDSIVSAKGKLDQADIPLAFVGKTEGQAVKAILIFTTGFKEVNLTGEIAESVLASVQNACKQYRAEARLKEEILQAVKSGKEEIINFFKEEQRIEKLKPREKIAEGEKLEYEVYISDPSGIGTETIEISKTNVKKKYLKNKNNYDIFVYLRSVYVKKGKELEFIRMDERIYKLLVIFLKYKDRHLDVIPLYRKAWFDTDDVDLTDTEEFIVKSYLKPAISELRTLMASVTFFEIIKPRYRGYMCRGHFKFCVIINKSEQEKYVLREFEE